ncbi:hypothetical protein MMC29_004211, partial [Sticta canariensis]|nr:hypothetical protein [Sticta canariensis]
MASTITALIPLLTSNFPILIFQIYDCLYLALAIGLAFYGLCWVTFDILMDCFELTEIPNSMVKLYFWLAPLFIPGFDIDVVVEDDGLSTHNPALSTWTLSVLAFALWALPDWVVTVDPERFLAEFDVDYLNDP